MSDMTCITTSKCDPKAQNAAWPEAVVTETHRQNSTTPVISHSYLTLSVQLRFVRRTAPSWTPSMSTLAVAIALSLIPTGAATSPRSIAGLKSGDAMGGKFLGGDAAGRTCCIPKVGEGCADRKARARQPSNIPASNSQAHAMAGA